MAQALAEWRAGNQTRPQPSPIGPLGPSAETPAGPPADPPRRPTRSEDDADWRRRASVPWPSGTR